MHIWEDNYIVEILDPVTLEPVPEGELYYKSPCCHYR